jgi:hypothetical protein
MLGRDLPTTAHMDTQPVSIHSKPIRRAELAVGYCKYMNLWDEAGSLLLRYRMDTQSVQSLA